MKASVCENKKSEIYANASTRTYVSIHVGEIEGRGDVRVRACMRKKNMRNLILKPFHGFCENLHHRKFPAIRCCTILTT